MTNNNSKRSVRIAGLVFSLIFGFIVISATTVNAQMTATIAAMTIKRINEMTATEMTVTEMIVTTMMMTMTIIMTIIAITIATTTVMKMIVTIETIIFRDRLTATVIVRVCRMLEVVAALMRIAPPDKRCAV